MTLPIYYINLADRPDRRAFMESQFTGLGLRAERIDAVRREDVSAIPTPRPSPERPNGLSSSELACSLSHELAWTKLLESPASHAVVFEDDAVLSPKLRAFLEALDCEPFDLIRLETVRRRVRVLPHTHSFGPVRLRPFRSTEFGSAGYIVSRSAADFLQKTKLQRIVPIDHALFCPFRSLLPSRRRVLADPALCIQLNYYRGEQSAAAGDVTGSAGHAHDSLGHAMYLKWLDLQRTLDHIANLPRGLTREVIEFSE